MVGGEEKKMENMILERDVNVQLEENSGYRQIKKSNRNCKYKLKKVQEVQEEQSEKVDEKNNMKKKKNKYKIKNKFLRYF